MKMTGAWVLAFAAQWVLLLLLTLLVAGMLRYLTSFEERAELAAPHISRFEVGESPEPFVLPDLAGHDVDSGRLVAGRYAIILLTTPGCSACDTLTMQVAELASREGGLPAVGCLIIIVVGSSHDKAAALIDKLGGAVPPGVTLLIDEKGTVTRNYGVRSNPVGIALSDRGEVVSQSMNPHINWLYKVLDVLPPERPVAADQHGVDTLWLPAGLTRQ